ncbi:hypothetical protein [Arthrobacter oryzae]|uniref:Lipoprotein n=1 Tax=Arthrobacter oryzae TaxID=409290 RepID=A0A495FM58_9MICC|nr:hypothetical protein [Arthrobacter oryzae]RKR29801.1 hypothetical protein C8D78_0116 [Arthrobacter oryzae]
MKNRSLVALLMLPPLMLVGCAPEKLACPAMGYVNLDAVQLDLSGVPGVLAVSACFGTNDRCTPVPVTRDSSGRWLVPQKPPFVQPANASVPIPRIRVVATRADKSVTDHFYTVGHTPPRGGCDNSYELLPVKVS